jgi:branched-chain amino acid transport system permease protein
MLIEVEVLKSILIYGLISSGMYALLAVGFSLIYGVTEVTNLSHGALYMIGTYVFFFFATSYGGIQLDLLSALILAAIIVAIVSSILYRLTIDPVVEDPLSVMVVTLSLAMIMQEAMVLTFGSYRQPVPSIWKALAEMLGTEDFVMILGVKLTYSKILSCVLSLALFAILLTYISKTKTGRAMRALSQDREVAMLMGINTKRLSMLAMGISASFAAVAGILITSSTGGGVTYPHIWQTPLFMAFAIVVLGGLGSIKGALVGAFIIGYIETIFPFAIDPIIADILKVPKGASLSGAVIMATMLAVLLIRPKGLFGKRVELED